MLVALKRIMLCFGARQAGSVRAIKNDMIVCFSLKSPFFLVRYINEALQQQYGVVDYP